MQNNARNFIMSSFFNRTKKINQLRLTSVFVLLLIFSAIVPNFLFADEIVTPEQAQELRTKLIDEAMLHLGAPYVYGATGPDSFDCSGFIRYVAAKSCGVVLKRTSQLIYGQARAIRISNAEVGDLVFFKEGNQNSDALGEITHVGIYIGNNEFIHAASDGPEKGVIISSLSERYWSNTFFSAGQILPSALKGGKFTGNLNSAENENVAAMFEKKPMTVNTFLTNFETEALVTANWSFANATPDYYINFRGVTGTLFFSYEISGITPGAGLMFRYNAGTKAFQLPLILGITFAKYFRIYGGPVFLFGDNYAPGTEELFNTKSRIAGIFGIAGRTPAVKLGPLEARLVQEINYTTYTAKEGSYLSGRDLALSGLEFSTGISITLPFRVFAK